VFGRVDRDSAPPALDAITKELPDNKRSSSQNQEEKAQSDRGADGGATTEDIGDADRAIVSAPYSVCVVTSTHTSHSVACAVVAALVGTVGDDIGAECEIDIRVAKVLHANMVLARHQLRRANLNRLLFLTLDADVIKVGLGGEAVQRNEQVELSNSGGAVHVNSDLKVNIVVILRLGDVNLEELPL